METTEGNKLIAEFTGGVYSFSEKEYEWKWENCLIKTSKVADLKYHSSWDWLMPAWSKFYGSALAIISSRRPNNLEMGQFDIWENNFHSAASVNSVVDAWSILKLAIQWYNEILADQ